MFKIQSPWLPRLLISLSLFLLFVLGMPNNPAQALIRETVEKPGQVVYQSRQTLKDEQGNTWQVVLFKRVKDGTEADFDLRLVGFPGMTAFKHPASLVVHPDGSSDFELKDAFAEENPGENVGQYHISETFETSQPASIWELELPLVDQKNSIKVPYFVLQEWQELFAKN